MLFMAFLLFRVAVGAEGFALDLDRPGAFGKPRERYFFQRERREPESRKEPALQRRGPSCQPPFWRVSRFLPWPRFSGRT